MANAMGFARCFLYGLLGLLGLLGLPSTAFAAHPLQTEDTGTQGAGNVEWENGLSWTRTDGTAVFAYQPQISYGLTTAVDLIVQPSWLDSTDQQGNTSRGRGDTNLDAKWRFYGAAPVSIAIRSGATLPTAARGLGLPRGRVSTHALVVATADFAPFTLHVNAGLARNPASSGQRRTIALFSGAAMWAPNERWTWTIDIGSSSNADPSRYEWRSTALVGVIYTVRPGLDLDAGVQSTVGASPSAREWLLGLTYRFAP